MNTTSLFPHRTQPSRPGAPIPGRSPSSDQPIRSRIFAPVWKSTSEVGKLRQLNQTQLDHRVDGVEPSRHRAGGVRALGALAPSRSAFARARAPCSRPVRGPPRASRQALGGRAAPATARNSCGSACCFYGRRRRAVDCDAAAHATAHSAAPRPRPVLVRHCTASLD